MRRYQQRIDANQPEIVKALRDAGCSVAVLNDLVDLAIGYGGVTMLAEVKNGPKPLKKGRQADFHATWTGGIRLLRSLDDVPPTVAELMRRQRLYVSREST